jgi:parallel beta-helix repeat protein
VGLRGEGSGETTIDAGTADFGLSIDGGSGAEVSDLSIRGGKTGLLVKGATGAAVRRVRVTGATNGIRLVDTVRSRVENAISAENRYGVLVTGGRENVVVNCTMANNKSLGLSLASGAGHAAFNNCVISDATAVYVGEVEGVRLDHNLYSGSVVGKLGDQFGRRSLEDWKYLSGLDAHSVEFHVKFRDPAAGDYRPSGALSWSLARSTVSDWGVPRLGGFDAPERDIDGKTRVGHHDVGAYEMTTDPPRPPDGTLVVRSDEGIKSAGIFDARGREVAYLFHNLPLRAGEHPFWFPARDYVGRKIPPGTYEVRSVEADHRWDYLGWVGDTGEAYPPGHTASAGLAAVAFDDAGHLIAAQGWSEDATNLRSFDAATGKIAWTFPGSAMSSGLAFGSDGIVYYSQQAGAKDWVLYRLEPSSGKLLPAGTKGDWHVRLDLGPDIWGLAQLDGKIYVTDTKANKVRIGPADGSRWEGAVDIPAPSGPVADSTTHVVWVISEGRRVLALGPDGRVIAERDFSGLAPRALAAGQGRLAIATGAEGLVRVLELPDPKAKAKSGWTVGRGDGPFGPYLPDRFLFQQAAGVPYSHVALALGPKGELAVVDQNRLLVFDEKGHHRWGTFGIFGNGTMPSFSDPRRVYDIDGRRSFLLTIDPEGRGEWRPEGYFDQPVTGTFRGDFRFGGKVYGIFQIEAPNKPSDLVVVRFDGFRAVPVYAIFHEPKRGVYFSRKDANHDGKLDARDGGEILKEPDGRPFSGFVMHRYSILQPNGDLLLCDMAPDRWGTLWHPSPDADGTPIYRIEGREPLTRPAGGLISPYTRKPDGTNGFTWAVSDPRGGTIANVFLNDTPDGVGILNNAGTDVVSFDRRGEVRWFHATDRDKGLEGLSAAGPVVMAGIATTAEVIVMNRDGLGLGSFSPAAKAHYQGYFLDGPTAVRAYQGPDDQTYALVADNFNGRNHWYRLVGQDRIKPATTPVTLGPESAEALARLPSPPAYTPTRSAPPVVRIPRLAGPLPIDGDLEKWRKARVTPQVVITPETSGGGIDGPRDSSAIVRLAYQGNDLYAQFLLFDDVVSFHQPVATRYLQDGIEICLNGFQSGFKFESTITTDAGPLVFRNRFFFGKVDWKMPEDHVPRSIRVLDDARDVPERELIEDVYGVDLRGSRVIVIEFKLPIDEITYKDSLKELKDITPWGPGREFWLGFLINDNDVPGTTVQNFLVWPATYNNFGPKEDGARAILE